MDGEIDQDENLGNRGDISTQQTVDLEVGEQGQWRNISSASTGIYRKMTSTVSQPKQYPSQYQDEDVLADAMEHEEIHGSDVEEPLEFASHAQQESFTKNEFISTERDNNYDEVSQNTKWNSDFWDYTSNQKPSHESYMSTTNMKIQSNDVEYLPTASKPYHSFNDKIQGDMMESSSFYDSSFFSNSLPRRRTLSSPAPSPTSQSEHPPLISQQLQSENDHFKHIIPDHELASEVDSNRARRRKRYKTIDHVEHNDDCVVKASSSRDESVSLTSESATSSNNPATAGGSAASNSGIRASLDVGMAALARWIRSKKKKDLRAEDRDSDNDTNIVDITDTSHPLDCAYDPMIVGNEDVFALSVAGGSGLHSSSGRRRRPQKQRQPSSDNGKDNPDSTTECYSDDDRQRVGKGHYAFIHENDLYHSSQATLSSNDASPPPWSSFYSGHTHDDSGNNATGSVGQYAVTLPGETVRTRDQRAFSEPDGLSFARYFSFSRTAVRREAEETQNLIPSETSSKYVHREKHKALRRRSKNQIATSIPSSSENDDNNTTGMTAGGMAASQPWFSSSCSSTTSSSSGTTSSYTDDNQRHVLASRNQTSSPTFDHDTYENFAVMGRATLKEGADNPSISTGSEDSRDDASHVSSSNNSMHSTTYSNDDIEHGFGTADEHLSVGAESNNIISNINTEQIEDTNIPNAQNFNNIQATNRNQDNERIARSRWVRINQRFQIIITIVALLFSVVLFSIIVCWVVVTSAYVLSIEKGCDVPLKIYFWLSTLQLILELFRTDIMQYIMRWDSRNHENVPIRVIVYNVCYFFFAMLVLRMGMVCVFFSPRSTCAQTAPELFKSSRVFISLSLAAWCIILLGYVVPFCVVIALLTRNGYSPTMSNTGTGFGGQGNLFIPSVSNGAPEGTIDRLQVVLLEDFPDGWTRDCCICMDDFSAGEVIVSTECEHVFHKRCFKEWLGHSRTCPVCRTDVPNSIRSYAPMYAAEGEHDDNNDENDHHDEDVAVREPNNNSNNSNTSDSDSPPEETDTSSRATSPSPERRRIRTIAVRDALRRFLRHQENHIYGRRMVRG